MLCSSENSNFAHPWTSAGLMSDYPRRGRFYQHRIQQLQLLDILGLGSHLHRRNQGRGALKLKESKDLYNDMFCPNLLKDVLLESHPALSNMRENVMKLINGAKSVAFMYKVENRPTHLPFLHSLPLLLHLFTGVVKKWVLSCVNLLLWSRAAKKGYHTT